MFEGMSMIAPLLVTLYVLNQDPIRPWALVVRLTNKSHESATMLLKSFSTFEECKFSRSGFNNYLSTKNYKLADLSAGESKCVYVGKSDPV